jgi:hypothetical protein
VEPAGDAPLAGEIQAALEDAAGAVDVTPVEVRTPSAIVW